MQRLVALHVGMFMAGLFECLEDDDGIQKTKYGKCTT